MIPLPEDWYIGGDSLENQLHGVEPVFFFTFIPNYFPNGVGEGSGVFVNTSFVAPDRIQVNPGVGFASWTSPELQAIQENYPIILTPTWDLNYPGFEVAIEFRTATSEGDLADTPWVTMVNGAPVSGYRYYQWRISFVAIRSWAYDTVEEAEASDSSAWALDAPDPEDPYQSFAVDAAYSGSGTAAYIEHVRFTGVYEIPQDDVKDPGTCIDQCSPEIGDLVAGDHTLTLLNRDNKHSRAHDNFIFKGQNWKKKRLRIEMAYKLLNGQVTSRMIIYEGIIQNWGPTPHRVDQRGKMEEHTVSVRTRDDMADILEQKIGTPADDGKSNPLVFGPIFRQAEQLGDETLGDPDATADFESGDTSELAGVDSGGGGIVEIDDLDPYDGAYCLQTQVAAAGAYAKGRLDLMPTSSEVLFKVAIKFVTIPTVPADKNMHFMGLYDTGGNEILQLYVGNDYRVHAYAGGQWKETDWYINQDVGVYKTVSTGVSGANPGTIKIWVSGNEVLTWDADWSGWSIKGGFIGPHNGAAAEEWLIRSDAWKIYPNWWPQLYRVGGGPFESIGTIYVDGAIKVGAGSLYPARDRRRLRYASPGLALSYVGGATKTADVEKYPYYGAVAFTDYANQVGGTVMVALIKDSCSHPVDVIRGILVAGGKEALVHDDSFAEAKAARPGDSIGAFFEDCTMGDAIKAVAAPCLLDVFRSQNRIKIKAYTGAPPETYDMDLDELVLVGTDPNVESNIKNKVFVKWGWYQRNPSLSYTAKDEQSIEDDGLYETEVDFSHGGMVESDNAEMAIRNAEMMLKRLVGGRLAHENVSASLRLVRVEPGDVVRVNLPYLGAPELLRVSKKPIRMGTPKGVDLTLVKYLGEEASS